MNDSFILSFKCSVTLTNGLKQFQLIFPTTQLFSIFLNSSRKTVFLLGGVDVTFLAVLYAVCIGGQKHENSEKKVWTIYIGSRLVFGIGRLPKNDETLSFVCLR